MHFIFHILRMVIFTISCLSFIPAHAAVIPLTYTFLTDTPTSAVAVLQGGFEAHIGSNSETIEGDFSLSITGTNWNTSIFFQLDIFTFEVEDEPGTFDEGFSWSVSQILGRHIINPHGAGEAPTASQLQIGFDILPVDNEGNTDFGDYAFEDIQGSNPETSIYVGFDKDSIAHIALPGPHIDLMTASLLDLDAGSQRFLGTTVSSGGEISLVVRLTHEINQINVSEPSSILLLFIGLLIISIRTRETLFRSQ